MRHEISIHNLTSLISSIGYFTFFYLKMEKMIGNEYIEQNKSVVSGYSVY